MKAKYIFGVIGSLMVLAVVSGYLNFDFNQTINTPSQTALDLSVQVSPSSTTCKPTFADGGGPYYKPNSPFRTNIAPINHSGEKLIVRGRVLRNDCITPVANAVLDIWQANESGSYQAEWYRGKVQTDNEGNYLFETVIPKGYGQGTGYRPPHIHFKVFVGSTEIITSQMFLPEVQGRPGFDDAYIMKLERKTEEETVINEGYHDIVLP